MKSLNQTLRTILFILAAIGTTSSALSYDFEVNGIYYNINGDEASVTYHDYTQVQVTGSGSYWFVYHYNYYAGYRGQVIIPETVTYNNRTYCVTKIGEHAFEECSGITSVIIPNTITVVEDYAFNVCNSLQGVTCMALTPPSCSSLSHYSATLYVPLESLELYKSASAWNNFSNIIGFGQNTFSIADHTTLYGDTIVIPVTMENVDDITAFQTDIYLYAGFELLKEGNDYNVSLSSRKSRDHVIMTSDAPDGAVRVLSYSPTLKKFSGNDGELFYLTIKVPNDGNGIVTYPIWLRKILLTTTDEEEIGALETLGNVNVYFYILGDVDHSGTITVTDVVFTAKYILFQNPEPFIFEAADMNEDSKITITDVVKIAHLILDQDYDEPSQLHMMAPNMGGDRMNGEAVGNTVSINLDNEMEYTAMQMDLTLPEGMNASELALTNRASELGLIVKDRGNGKVRVLAYSPNLKTIKGSEGAVLTFNVDGAMGEIMVDRIELVNLEGVAVRLGAFTIAANNPTALDEMNARKTIASVKYFNLAGQQMTELTDGVNLVVTTYTDGTRTTSKIIR
jgi:hypothetical protein